MEAFIQKFSVKNVFLKVLQNTQEKFTGKQVLSYEFCQIFKNTFFIENLWMAASIIPKSSSWIEKKGPILMLSILHKKWIFPVSVTKSTANCQYQSSNKPTSWFCSVIYICLKLANLWINRYNSSPTYLRCLVRLKTVAFVKSFY